MYSIYHFFGSLIERKHLFKRGGKLENFPFDKNLLSCKNAGKFPDMAIKLNNDGVLFKGGELIELKESNSYSVSSFNSTIPTGRKEISKILRGKNSNIRSQMEAAGDDVDSLPIRDVYYLVRGRNRDKVKVVLVHGSFFETIKVKQLISQSFAQVLEDRLKQTGTQVNQELKDLLIEVFSEQESFSKVRSVDKSSVTLRFRVMTEIKAEGNILNSEKYPEILENTINFLVPCNSNQDEQEAKEKMKTVFGENGLGSFKVFKIKHHFNGFFLVFQQNI